MDFWRSGRLNGLLVLLPNLLINLPPSPFNTSVFCGLLFAGGGEGGGGGGGGGGGSEHSICVDLHDLLGLLRSGALFIVTGCKAGQAQKWNKKDIISF